MSLELLPTSTGVRTGAPVAVEVRSDGPVRGQLVVEHLGDCVAELVVDLPTGSGDIEVGALPRGGYAITLETDDAEVSTAVDVLDDPFERPRYGFLSDFPPGRDDVAETVDDLRRLHVNVVQFYDWMYRHEELLGPSAEFTDALGRDTSHDTTRALVAALAEVGAHALGYAAVYGVSNAYAAEHGDELLYRSDGTTPWTLGDFLAITDPSPGGSWLARFRDQLAVATDRMGFAGFHLDQYGWPKLAARRDRTLVDLAETFPAMIAAIREELPDAKLIFNNVNDFPTSTTALAPQDAVYIEVWSPYDTYDDLADLIGRARRDGRDKPVILAAYLEPYAEEAADRADAAAVLAFATIAAHGGHHLLCGERRGVLVDPYYPNYHRASDTSFGVLRRLFDAAVALGDLLYEDGPVVTDSWFGGINEEIVVEGPVPVHGRATAGSLWPIVRHGPERTTIHLVDLVDQHDTDWNRGKEPLRRRTDIRVGISVPGAVRVLFAAPTSGCRVRELAAERRGDHVVVALPPFTGWAVISILSA